jgi:conjugative transfer signal peptidase TraF
MVSAGFGSLGRRLALQRLQAARQPFGFLVGLGLFLAVLLAVGNALGLLISNTDSAAPAGIYRMVSLEVKRGDLVGASLPFDIAQQGLSRGYLQTGPCVGSAEPVWKIAGALPGDIIDIERDWIAVSGGRIPHGAVASHDSAGRPLHRASWGNHKVAGREVWLLGLNDRRRWESRYFGPVPLASVWAQVEPIFHVVRGDG